MSLTILTPLSLFNRTNNPPALPLLYPPPPTALKSFNDFNDPNDPNDPNDLKALKAPISPNVLFPLKNNPRRPVKSARTRRNSAKNPIRS